MIIARLVTVVIDDLCTFTMPSLLNPEVTGLRDLPSITNNLCVRSGAIDALSEIQELKALLVFKYLRVLRVVMTIKAHTQGQL